MITRAEFMKEDIEHGAGIGLQLAKILRFYNICTIGELIDFDKSKVDDKIRGFFLTLHRIITLNRNVADSLPTEDEIK